MSENTINNIGHENTGQVIGLTLPIGSKVTLNNWPAPGKVIGHHDGVPIIELEPCCVPISSIKTYTDANGLTKMPFYQR